EIVICQELFEYFLSLAEQFDDPDQVEQLMLDSVVFTGLHEWGHAAIDLYDIPITGREEDVADQVATWLTIEAVGENAEEALTTMLNASLLFLVQGENMADDESAYWDSHSLDMQRFYNMLCWSYGFDPDLTNKVTGEPVEEIIPEERLASCSEEYQRMFDSLSSLMADHLRE
ncbi:MAG: DUF4344 domain-containing metallopeptidase, partial [Proteobacteria bacterium]|nr:DUF4344 domain-containing metallopeptidase [Pseudomonadota bacterium]MBU1610671.1 DUF4344 domain-containing metallopeptidase [Pseudomonadota bacterium]